MIQARSDRLVVPDSLDCSIKIVHAGTVHSSSQVDSITFRTAVPTSLAADGLQQRQQHPALPDRGASIQRAWKDNKHPQGLRDGSGSEGAGGCFRSRVVGGGVGGLGQSQAWHDNLATAFATGPRPTTSHQHSKPATRQSSGPKGFHAYGVQGDGGYGIEVGKGRELHARNVPLGRGVGRQREGSRRASRERVSSSKHGSVTEAVPRLGRLAVYSGGQCSGERVAVGTAGSGTTGPRREEPGGTRGGGNERIRQVERWSRVKNGGGLSISGFGVGGGGGPGSGQAGRSGSKERQAELARRKPTHPLPTSPGPPSPSAAARGLGRR